MARLPRYPRTGGAAPMGGALGDEAKKPSGYAEKLAKYVPAEVIAGWAPLYILSLESGKVDYGLAWGLLGVGIAATLIYVTVRARMEPETPRPWYFWVLSVGAFLGWSLGTTTVGSDLVGLQPRVSAVILGIMVFLLPGIDALLTGRTARKEGGELK
jgi:hypothetical protein